MADSWNSNSSSLKAYSKNGSCVDLKAKLRKAEIADGLIEGAIKWALWIERNTFALVFDEVEEGGPLHQCGIRNGDELTTVNYASVNSSDDVNHIASVIRDCSPTFILGIRRRRWVYSVPVMVVFELGDAGSNHVHKFCGFYWNVSLRDIPFIPFFIKTIVTYNFYKVLENVEVIGTKDNEQKWLTFKNNTLTFETIRSPFSIFNLYVYNQARLQPMIPACTPVIIVPQHDQSWALDATINDEIKMSPFSSTYYRGKDIPGSGLFLKAFGVTDDIFDIKSSQTDNYLEMVTLSSMEVLVPVLSPNPTKISLQDTTTGNYIVLKN